MWLLFALGSAFFAGITAVLAKLGIHGHDSTLVTALRTSVVFLGGWIVAAISIKGHFASELTAIAPHSYLFLFLSGLATGASWLCYYRALQEGPASIIVPIDKLSILVTVAFSALMLREHVSGRYLLGIASMCAGAVLMVIG